MPQSGVLLPSYQSGSFQLTDGAVVPYVRVGNGERRLVMIPGAGDGLQTVKDAAAQLAWTYRHRAQEYTTLFVSRRIPLDRKSTRLNSSHVAISYAVFCLKKK